MPAPSQKAQNKYKSPEPSEKSVFVDALQASADNFSDEEPGAKAARSQES